MKHHRNLPFFLTLCLSFLITPLTSLAAPPELLRAYALRHPGLSCPEAPFEALNVQWNAFLGQSLQAFKQLQQESLLPQDTSNFITASKSLNQHAYEVQEKLYPWLNAYGKGTLPSKQALLKKKTFTQDKKIFLKGFLSCAACIAFGMDGILHNEVSKQNGDYPLLVEIPSEKLTKASPVLRKYHDMVSTLTQSCLEILAHYEGNFNLPRALAEGTLIELPDETSRIAIIAASPANPFCVALTTNRAFESVGSHFGYEDLPLLGSQLCVAAFKDHLVDEAGIRIFYDSYTDPNYPLNVTLVYPLASGLLYSTEGKFNIMRGVFLSIDNEFENFFKKNPRLRSHSLFIPMPSSLQDTLIFNLLALEALGKKENRPLSEIFIQGQSLESLTQGLEEAFLQQEMAASSPAGDFLELQSLSEAYLERSQEEATEHPESYLAALASKLSLTSQDKPEITEDLPQRLNSLTQEEAAPLKAKASSKKNKASKGKGKKASLHKSPLASKPKDPAFEAPESPRAKAQKKLDELKLSGRTKWRSLLKIINSLDLSEVIAKQLPRYDGSHITLHQEGHPSLTLVKPHGSKDAAVPEKIYKSFFLEVLERSFKSAEG